MNEKCPIFLLLRLLHYFWCNVVVPNVIKSYFDSETNYFFTFIFAPVLAHEVSCVLLPTPVEN